MRILFGKRALHALVCGVALHLSSASTNAGAKEVDNVARTAHIERTRVESSSIVSVGFAREARILEIEFRSGAIYRYLGVPLAVFEEFKKAESKGRYFAKSIRGNYEFVRVGVFSK